MKVATSSARPGRYLGCSGAALSAAGVSTATAGAKHDGRQGEGSHAAAGHCAVQPHVQCLAQRNPHPALTWLQDSIGCCWCCWCCCCWLLRVRWRITRRALPLRLLARGRLLPTTLPAVAASAAAAAVDACCRCRAAAPPPLLPAIQQPRSQLIMLVPRCLPLLSRQIAAPQQHSELRQPGRDPLQAVVRHFAAEAAPRHGAAGRDSRQRSSARQAAHQGNVDTRGMHADTVACSGRRSACAAAPTAGTPPTRPALRCFALPSPYSRDARGGPAVVGIAVLVDIGQGVFLQGGRGASARALARPARRAIVPIEGPPERNGPLSILNVAAAPPALCAPRPAGLPPHLNSYNDLA